VWGSALPSFLLATPLFVNFQFADDFAVQYVNNYAAGSKHQSNKSAAAAGNKWSMDRLMSRRRRSRSDALFVESRTHGHSETHHTKYKVWYCSAASLSSLRLVYKLLARAHVYCDLGLTRHFQIIFLLKTRDAKGRWRKRDEESRKKGKERELEQKKRKKGIKVEKEKRRMKKKSRKESS